MIPNITHSTSSGNYLGYNLGDKKEQYQKVQFLAAEGVMINDRLIDRLNQNWKDGDEKGYHDFRKVAMAIANDIDNQFRAQAALNDRPKIRAINVSLSYSPEDTDKVNEVVYDETRDDYVPLRLKMGREFLDGMEFGDIQYVATSHLGTHCAHDHYAINTIRADGSTIKLNFDFNRAQKVAAEIRKKYGLALPDESLQRVTPRAKEALAHSCTWQEYGQYLQEHGISLVFSDHSKTGRGYGVSYSFGRKVIPGTKLNRALTYGKVTAVLERNLATRQAQEEANRLAEQQERQADAVDEQSEGARIEDLKKEFPFRGLDHVQYIIFSKNDAGIYRSLDKLNYKDEKEYAEYREWRQKYELARQALKEKILFVSGDEGPTDFYETLQQAKEDSSYRVGDIWIQPDGKIVFGQERVFGDPEKTEYSIPHVKNPSVRGQETASKKAQGIILPTVTVVSHHISSNGPVVRKGEDTYDESIKAAEQEDREERTGKKHSRSL